MKLAISGSRSIKPNMATRHFIEEVIRLYWPEEVLSGKGRDGVDQMVREATPPKETDFRYFPANWRSFGKKAGPMRNERMIDDADALVAFWDGHSPGTRHAIQYAKKKGKLKAVFFVDPS